MESNITLYRKAVMMLKRIDLRPEQQERWLKIKMQCLNNCVEGYFQ